MKTLRLILGMALIAFTFEQCAKGDTGAPGPVGPTGPQGYSGVTGASQTFTSNPADWSSMIVSGYNFTYAPYNASIITSNAVSNGVIALYFQTSTMATQQQWIPLPDTYPISGSVEQTMTYSYQPGYITLQIQNTDNSIPAAPAAFNVKVVVIPTAVIKQHPGANLKDYNTVKQMMNLRD